MNKRIKKAITKLGFEERGIIEELIEMLEEHLNGNLNFIFVEGSFAGILDKEELISLKEEVTNYSKGKLDVQDILTLTVEEIESLSPEQVDSFGDEHFNALRNRRKTLKSEKIFNNWMARRKQTENIDIKYNVNGKPMVEPTYYMVEEGRKMVVNYSRLAEVVMAIYPMVVIGKMFFIYEDGYYKEYPTNYIDALIKEIVPIELNVYNSALTREVKHNILTDSRVMAPLDSQDFSALTVRYTNLKNGIFDWYNKELIEHTSDIVTFSQVDGNYLPNAGLKSRYIDSLISFNFQNLDTQKTLWQIAATGYAPYVIKNAHLFMVGKSDGGKSTILEALFLPLNKSAKADITFDNLTKKSGEYWLKLLGKTVNIAPETGSTKAEALEGLKSATSGESFSTRLLNSNAVSYTNQATMIFGSNGDPKMDEASMAIANRFNFFVVSKSIPKEEQDAWLNDRIGIYDLDYITTRMINELLEIQENGNKIFISEEVKKWNDKYTRSNDSVASFVDSICIQHSKAMVPAKLLWDLYAEYCLKELEQNKKLKATFQQILKEKLNIDIGEEKEKRMPKSKMRAFIGIAIDLSKLEGMDFYQDLDFGLKNQVAAYFNNRDWTDVVRVKGQVEVEIEDPSAYFKLEVTPFGDTKSYVFQNEDDSLPF